MKKIIAIGGGDIRKKATAAIDQEIIRLSGIKQPNNTNKKAFAYSSVLYTRHREKREQ